MEVAEGKTRTFETGATRDTEEGKLDYEGFFSPVVLKRRAEYMHKHRTQKDGTVRASDNWQKGIPMEVYMKSLFRHFMDLWLWHRGGEIDADPEEVLCAIMFNAEGYLKELIDPAIRAADIPRPQFDEPVPSSPLTDDTPSRSRLLHFLRHVTP